MTTTPSSRFGELPFELPSCLQFLKLKNFPLKVYPAVNELETLKKDTLFVYGPGKHSWFDVDCLQIQMYLNFCGIDYDTYSINQPEASPSGELPFLETVVGKVLDAREIIHWLTETRNIQRELSNELDKQQAKAFVTLVEQKLKPALLFSMWLEPPNANEITFKSYYGHLPQPINQIVFYKKQSQVTKSLLADRDILVREEIYQDAMKVLEALSVKLGDDTYFFNSSEPTWIDAVVFSHLHCALAASIKEHAQYEKEAIKQAKTLSNMIRKYDNLFNYVKLMHQKWLKK